MARKRMIHDTIWESDQFCSLESVERELYIYFINIGDDEGRFKTSPSRVCRRVFPIRDEDTPRPAYAVAHEITPHMVQQMIERLAISGLIKLYKVGGELYGFHPNWDSYQTIRKDRFSKSDLPAPEESQIWIPPNYKNISNNNLYNSVNQEDNLDWSEIDDDDDMWCDDLETTPENTTQPSDNQLSTNCQPSDNQVTTQPNLTKPNLTKPNLKENIGTETAPNNTSKKNKKASMNEGCVIDLCLLLFRLIRQNYPDFKSAYQSDNEILNAIKTDHWYEEMRRLIDIDKKHMGQIELIMKCVHGGNIAFDSLEEDGNRPVIDHYVERDDFWYKNILSPLKLRKHFDTLVIHFKDKSKPKSKIGYL